MATPHIAAEPGAFAKTVLMPGDPLRAKFIAENFLQDAKLVNNVRGIHGYTGTYKGVPVSVMASGMGMPSMGIYSYELFHFFDVDNIIRVGSAGAYSPYLELRDVVLAMGACTDSAYLRQYCLPGDFAPIASYRLLRLAEDAAAASGIKCTVGNVLSSDCFYGDNENATALWTKMGVLAVEMESAALYANAARCGKNALTILTVSDHVTMGGATTAEERERTFTDMIGIALETAKAAAEEN